MSGSTAYTVAEAFGFDGFCSASIPTERGLIYTLRAGNRPAVLLLHGFPETHLMWRDVAPLLAERSAVVCADLPGYGRSDCPHDDDGSKRAMARDLVATMAALGHDRFAVVGHDRGGRVAYRMALDHPDVVTRAAVLDVIPTGAVWARAEARAMLGFWPFSLLAQPAPLPERLIAGCPKAVVDDAVANWGTAADLFPPEVRAAYVEALSDPAHVHAICQEYRAAATVDREQDDADLAAGRQMVCPTLALWSAAGGLNSWYADEGGPLAIWQRYAAHVEGGPVPGGHFFPEEHPTDLAARLTAFLSA